MVSKDSELKSHKKQQKEENSERFREIKDVLRKNQITRGVTPEKLRMILEELGPTYIKLGQLCLCIRIFFRKRTVMNY